MSKGKANTNSRILLAAVSLSLCSGYLPAASYAEGELNFKLYSPDNSTSEAEKSKTETLPQADAAPSEEAIGGLGQQTKDTNNHEMTPSGGDSLLENEKTGVSLSEETPIDDATNPVNSGGKQESAFTQPSPASDKTASDSLLEPTRTESLQGASDSTGLQSSSQSLDKTNSLSNETEAKTDSNKVLKGYVQVVPSGTKIPIIMDTAVDSDTSQEGDEFSARTAEDLTIDGTTVVPAGSIIRGRIATINAPKHLDRSGSVALKFDTVTTPDNRQIPLVANLVARGGVVHARRGVKDIAIDTGVAALPAVIGVGIGAVAGNSSNSKVGVGGGALIGAGIGVAVGVAILLAKKGKKVDVRPGDELKIELAEDLHMPTM